MNKKQMKKAGLIGTLLIALCLSGCGPANVTGAGAMVKTGSVNAEEKAVYSDVDPADELSDTILSEDGLCEIRKFAVYYDVVLDYEKGSPKEVGAAYAATIKKAVPDYEARLEPYLYENIRHAFAGRNINYKGLEERIRTLEAAIPEDYRQEIEGFAGTISDGREGYAEDGKLSYIEAITMQMIPDALRGTACSALSLDGSITESGERITMRNLEWNLGSQAQMTTIHAVTHMKKADRSITAISMLGLLDIITAVNDDGVMIGILDVSSGTAAMDSLPFVYEGKKCYTYEIRYALEQYDNAREAGEFLVSESADFTWCNNLLVTDKKDAFCCENATRETQEAGRAHSVLRGTDTELMEGLKWDRPEALCIVNSFATKGNKDSFTGEDFNIDRFGKYNDWMNAKETFSVADIKAIMAQETVKENGIANVHNAGTVHTVIADYASETIQVAFTKDYYADDVPEYVTVGHFSVR